MRSRKTGGPARSGKKGRKTTYTYTNLGVDSSLLKGKYTHLCRHFVRVAPCVLSENLCTTLGYAKGTQGTFESVVWDPRDGEVPDINSLQPGVITNVMQPRFIIIRVKGKLLPIGTCNGKIETFKKGKKRITNFRKHPVDLLFAVTYHKLQGVTLDKLILSINKHPCPKLRLVLSSLYVGLSRVHKWDDIRVLPYTSEDVDYLITLKFDDLLKDWVNNYTKKGRWKYDGFKKFEQNMLKKTKLDLGLVDDLAVLTIAECKLYLSNLDIISTGTKVTDLRSALRESYSHGRKLLNSDNGALLVRQRISLYGQLKKHGDYSKLTLSRLRYYAKRLGISKCGKMRKRTILLALNKFETTHCAGMSRGTKTHVADVWSLPDHFRQKHGFHAFSKPADARPVPRKRRKTNLPYVCADTQPVMSQRTYKGLQNPDNRCYFNSVIQCLLYCPLARQAIESLPRDAFHVLRELHTLFNRMCSNDASTFVSPSECFKAVMNTRECNVVQMGSNERQEDVHEFFLKLLEHFDEELTVIAETFSMPNIFNINIRSTITCRQCLRSSAETEWLWVLSLHFPLRYNEDAADEFSNAILITSLMDSYFKVEPLTEHRCLQCSFIGGIGKKLDIINAPRLLVLHISRFTSAFVKIETFVEFQTELTTDYIRGRNGQQMRYWLTGVICHTGLTMASGHYIAYVLIDGDWYEANDRRMTQVSWQTVRRLQVYMLFYESL